MTEERVIGSDFIDSSIWLSYFIDGINIDIIERDELLLTSVLSLFEIKRRLLENKVPENVVNDKINFVKKKSLIISISNELVEKAAKVCVEKNLHAMDAIIYVSSLKQNATFITHDNDFRGLDKVSILDK